MSKCPKCGRKLSPLYFKENCPDCGVNLLYYNLDKRLESDAAQAEKETAAVKRFLDVLRSSSVAAPVLIVRLVLFFTPLASMCLPMYGDLSLISVIKAIIDGNMPDILPLVSMGLVVVLSLAVIISSLFSSTKTGLLRNLIFSAVNTIALVVTGIIIGGLGAGWYVTLAIYISEIVLHFICDKKIKNS